MAKRKRRGIRVMAYYPAIEEYLAQQQGRGRRPTDDAEPLDEPAVQEPAREPEEPIVSDTISVGSRPAGDTLKTPQEDILKMLRQQAESERLRASYEQEFGEKPGRWEPPSQEQAGPIQEATGQQQGVAGPYTTTQTSQQLPGGEQQTTVGAGDPQALRAAAGRLAQQRMAQPPRRETTGAMGGPGGPGEERAALGVGGRDETVEDYDSSAEDEAAESLKQGKMPFAGLHEGRIRPVDVKRAAKNSGMSKMDYLQLVDESGVQETGMAEQYASEMDRARAGLSGMKMPPDQMEETAHKIALAQVESRQKQKMEEGKRTFTLVRDNAKREWQRIENGLNRTFKEQMAEAKTQDEKDIVEQRHLNTLAEQQERSSDRLIEMTQSTAARQQLEELKIKQQDAIETRREDLKLRMQQTAMKGTAENQAKRLADSAAKTASAQEEENRRARLDTHGKLVGAYEALKVAKAAGKPDQEHIARIETYILDLDNEIKARSAKPQALPSDVEAEKATLSEHISQSDADPELQGMLKQAINALENGDAAAYNEAMRQVHAAHPELF